MALNGDKFDTLILSHLSTFCHKLLTCHFFEHNGLGVDGDTLGGVVSFVDADKAVCNFKHVVPQRDYNKLGILGLFLKKKHEENHVNK